MNTKMKKILFGFLFFIKKIIAGEHQKRLLEKLFKNYEPLERPVEDDNQV